MFHILYHLDANLLLFIQEHMRSPLLTPAFKFITTLGNDGMIWIVLILGLLCNQKTRKTGIAALITLILCYFINNVMLKNLIARPRPFDALSQLQVLIRKPRDYSFPSGHTAMSFAVAGAIYYSGNKKIGIAALILAGAIGFSRLYLGVHYPSDVLGGACVGLLISLIVSMIFMYLHSKQKVKVMNT